MVPLNTDTTFESWIVSVSGRKITTRGRLVSADGLLLAEGEALCVRLADEHLEKFAAVRAARQPKKG